MIFEGKRTTAVEVLFEGKAHRIGAGREIVLSLGAVNTPKVLMQSGVGDEEELRRFGIDVVRHLPGVGCNLQDHPVFAGCVWECEEPLPARNNGGEATFFWKSDPSLDTPDLMPFQREHPYVSPETARLDPPASSWSMTPQTSYVPAARRACGSRERARPIQSTSTETTWATPPT